MMENTSNWVQKRQQLRAEAEAMIASFSAPGTNAQSWDVLCHELMVHKVELEMQVEEMRRANFEMQALNALYQSRYELSPAASFSIDAKGLISHANAAAAQLLGFSRGQLLEFPLAKFIAGTADADRWHLLHRQGMQAGAAAQPPFVLTMGRADGQPLQVLCISGALAHDGHAALVQLVMFDLRSLQLAQAGSPRHMQNAP